jgi:L-ribulose-5-phosphate 4-epimerase
MREEGEAMLLSEQRRQVVDVGLAALAAGVVHGTAGNMSVRDPASGLIAISPSGMPYPTVTPEDVVIVDADGVVRDGRRKPSSETPLHTMLYRARSDIGAVVHTHSHFATVVGTIRHALPPILTEVCLVVGPRVPVTRYGLTGTADFGESVLEVLPNAGSAVLLRNHGLVTWGADFAEALAVAEVVEEAAKVYAHALAANGGREPSLVPEELIPAMRERFLATYGQR